MYLSIFNKIELDTYIALSRLSTFIISWVSKIFSTKFEQVVCRNYFIVTSVLWPCGVVRPLLKYLCVYYWSNFFLWIGEFEKIIRNFSFSFLKVSLLDFYIIISSWKTVEITPEERNSLSQEPTCARSH